MIHKLLLSIALSLPLQAIAVPKITPLAIPIPKVEPSITELRTIKPAPIWESVWESVVVNKVYDGDTFTATRNGKSLRVRVTWVNTPELKSNQFYAKEAREVLVKALASGNVEIQSVGKSFDREVAHVRTKVISNIGLYLVEQGAGIAYPTCQQKCPRTWRIVQMAQDSAKQLKLGIWQKSTPDSNLIAQ
jgi:endonuclease YncB( thermonuclease family)